MLVFNPKDGPISSPGIAPGVSMNWGGKKQKYQIKLLNMFLMHTGVCVCVWVYSKFPCRYLKQLSIVPGPTDQSVNLPAQQEQHQHDNHEQPGEDEAETCAPATTPGSEVKQRAHSGKRFEDISSGTHIMRKMPPQSAVQERLVGSALDFRPIGPRSRPKRLHTTTRRTAQHRIRHTSHLETHAHGGNILSIF